jgi:fatty acid desaturase
MKLCGENSEKLIFCFFSRWVFLFPFLRFYIVGGSVFRCRGKAAKMKDDAGRASGTRSSWVLLSIVTIAFLAVVGGTPALPIFFITLKKKT